MRRLVVAATALALLVMPASPALARSEHNIVALENNRDDSDRTKVNVVATRASGAAAYNINRAVAEASCENCRTVAVAMQALLVTKGSDIQPVNEAIALNNQCTSCRTAAFAYQYVVTTDRRVRLDEDVREELEEIEEDAEDIAQSDLSFPEIDARLDALFVELKATVDEAIAEAGDRDADRDDDADDDVERGDDGDDD